MSRLGKIGLGVLAAFLLLLFWLIPLGALRGDQAEVDLAEQEADQAESEAQAAINANASAANELEVAASTEHMRRFASYLPEIEVERPRGVHRWYEQHIMTPAELQAYNGGTSNESVEATEPTYYSNNPHVLRRDCRRGSVLLDCILFGSAEPHSGAGAQRCGNQPHWLARRLSGGSGLDLLPVLRDSDERTRQQAVRLSPQAMDIAGQLRRISASVPLAAADRGSPT